MFKSCSSSLLVPDFVVNVPPIIISASVTVRANLNTSCSGLVSVICSPATEILKFASQEVKIHADDAEMEAQVL